MPTVVIIRTHDGPSDAAGDRAGNAHHARRSQRNSKGVGDASRVSQKPLPSLPPYGENRPEEVARSGTADATACRQMTQMTPRGGKVVRG